MFAIGRHAGVNSNASMALMSFCAAREKKISPFLETGYRFVQLLPRAPSAARLPGRGWSARRL
jgi:hypothetical protein